MMWSIFQLRHMGNGSIFFQWDTMLAKSGCNWLNPVDKPMRGEWWRTEGKLLSWVVLMSIWLNPGDQEWYWYTKAYELWASIGGTNNSSYWYVLGLVCFLKKQKKFDCAGQVQFSWVPNNLQHICMHISSQYSQVKGVYFNQSKIGPKRHLADVYH